MRKLLLLIFLAGSLVASAQPGNYMWRKTRERIYAGMFDSSLHIPSYNGVPSGLRSGSAVSDGAVAIDTANHYFYYYSNGGWIKSAKYSDLPTTIPISSLTAATGTNSISNGNYTQTWNWPTLTSGALLINAASTAMTNSSYVFGITNSGANASSGITSYSADIYNTHTGTTSTNVALRLNASGGTVNNALDIASGALTIGGSAGTSGQVLTSGGANALPTWATPSTVATAVPLSGITAATGTNSISNGDYTQTWNWNSLTDRALVLNSTSTTASAQELLRLVLSGANASSSVTSTNLSILNSHTGTSSTNVGISVSATGGTTNNALDIAAGALTLNGSAGTSGQVLTSGGANALPTWATPSSGGTPGGSDTYIQFNDGGSFGGDAGFTYNKTTNVFSTNNGAFRPTGTISFSDAGAGSVYRSSSDGLVFRAVTGSGYDLLMYDAVGNAVFGLEAGTSKLGSTSQIGAGLLGYGSWNAWMNLRGGTTTNASLTIRDGVAPTSPAEGQIWRTTDKVYNVIQTGAATKEFTLNDIALTTGRIPYTTTNGRLTDTATFLRSPGGSVSIGTSSPSASALLDVSSTTKGALMPRMTTTQRDAISSPATGLELFNTTTNSKQIYDGTRWVEAAHPLYKVYTALLTQSGTDAPTATVLENNLGGTVVWTRTDVGDYLATLSGAFTSGKTLIWVNTPSNSGYIGLGDQTSVVQAIYNNSNSIKLGSSGALNEADAQSDGLITGISLEIRVYY